MSLPSTAAVPAAPADASGVLTFPAGEAAVAIMKRKSDALDLDSDPSKQARVVDSAGVVGPSSNAGIGTIPVAGSGVLPCVFPTVGLTALTPLYVPGAATSVTTATPQSAAAFVAGAAAVTQALFQHQQQQPSSSAATAAASSATAAGSGETTTGGGGLNSSGDGQLLAADVARAAAAAAAAVTARQSCVNTAAKALQMACKTAELLHGGAATGTAGAAAAQPGVDPSPLTRHARKVYVGNLPVPVTQTEVQQYFNELLDSLLPNKIPGQTILHVYVNGARRFAFLEHRSIEEANFTIGLDGISWRNCCLSLRRPQDYNPTLAEQQYQEERARQGSMTGYAHPTPSAAAPTPATTPQSSLIAGALGIVSTTVPDSPHKIFLGGLPHSITEQGCKQLLEAFGQLRALHVVKDPQRGDCKGFAFCEYLDPNVTDVAVAGLNNMRIGDRVLQVRRAMPHGHLKGVGPDGQLLSGAPSMPSIVGSLSRVVAIHNMLPPLPLVPPLLREAVATEARIRSAAYGEVVYVDVLEAQATAAAAKGEGVPVLVEFKDVDSAIQALAGIQGTTYDGRSLSVVFAEPSPGMKKAAVMRIVMEAGESPTPAKLKQPSSAASSPQQLASESVPCTRSVASSQEAPQQQEIYQQQQQQELIQTENQGATSPQPQPAVAEQEQQTAVAQQQNQQKSKSCAVEESGSDIAAAKTSSAAAALATAPLITAGAEAAANSANAEDPIVPTSKSALLRERNGSQSDNSSVSALKETHNGTAAPVKDGLSGVA